MGGDLRSPPSCVKEWDGGGVQFGDGGKFKLAGGGAKEGLARSFKSDSIVAKGVAVFGGTDGCNSGGEPRSGGERFQMAGGGAKENAGRPFQADLCIATGAALSDGADGCNRGPNHRKGSAKSLQEAIGAKPFIPSRVQSSSGMEMEAEIAILPKSVLPSSDECMEVEVLASNLGRNVNTGLLHATTATTPAVLRDETTMDGGMDIDAATGQTGFRTCDSLAFSCMEPENDGLGAINTAGHSNNLEAAGNEPNVSAMNNSVDCTPGVCENAPTDFLGLNQQKTAHFSGKTANAWNLPRFVKFHNVEVAVAAAKEGKSVMLDRAVIQANRRKLEGAVVGKLMGRKLPFSFLNSELQRRWARFGQFQLITVSSDCFICIFEEHAARDEVLLGGPWIIAGQIIGLNRWTPSFSPSSLEGLTSPIWIRLPFLPLLYWDEESLGRIAAKFGEPIGMDAQTSRWGRNSYARVCVRMDLSQQLPKGVWIDGGEGEFFQQVEYEGISLLCFNCGRIGHKAAACISSTNGNQGSAPLQAIPGLEQNPGIKPPSITYSECLQQSVASPLKDSSKSSLDHVLGMKLTSNDIKDDGEWVLVTRRRNKPKQRPNKPAKDGASLPDASPSVQSAVPPPPDMPVPPDPSLISQPMDPSTTPTSPMEGSQHLCIPNAFTELDDRLNRKGKSSHGHRGRDRVSKAHFIKELSQLGPIAMKTRKKRKNIFDALNGGDNSPSGP